MSSDYADNAKSTYLEKQERYLGDHFKYAYNDHNEHGVVAVMVLEMARESAVADTIYGKYSKMKPSIRNFFRALDAAVVASGSINGKGKRDLLQNRTRIDYTGMPGGMPNPDLMRRKEPGISEQLSAQMGLTKSENALRDPSMSL